MCQEGNKFPEEKENFMAKIILVTAADERTGDEQRESRLGEKPVAWCITHLQLADDPIPLAENIALMRDSNDRGSTQKVFVKVTEDEAASISAGFYPSDKNPSEIRELLRSERS